jgi:glycosyltransferase involved in cell wall biosynthesis
VVRVPLAGGPITRWRKYAKALRQAGQDADIVYAFSSVSCGVPMMIAGLKKPKKLLRLGGDFLWERYTDKGGRRTLKEFYQRFPLLRAIMGRILKTFDHIVFSTVFQQELYQRFYKHLPVNSVIENAVPAKEVTEHTRHAPLRVLFMGRFVRFKNLPALLTAVAGLPHVRLTLVGDGPVLKKAQALAKTLPIFPRVTFLPPATGADKDHILREHDLLILPSLTEISPHMAVEARASGLPVLLSQETGLSDALRSGMMIRELRTSADITRALLEVDQKYEQISADAMLPYHPRGWSDVAEEHLTLFTIMDPDSKSQNS